MVPRPAKAWPQAPTGFKVEQYTTGLENPREIRTAPNGDLFVAESAPGRVKVFRGIGKDSKPEQMSVFATGLTLPFGIAFYPPGPNPQYVYVANTDSVVRFPYQNRALQARGPSQTIVPNLPGFGRLRGGGHWTRDLAFSSDGKRMFVSVGSHSNVEDSDNNPPEFHRANILVASPDGADLKVYAWGIRNPVGITINPQTGELWASVNERDLLGDNLPPDYITHVQEGGFSSESEISSTTEISSRSMTNRVRKSSSLDTDIKPHKKNKVINNEPKIGDINEESQELLVSVQPENLLVENSLADVSRHISEVQDIPPSPASKKRCRNEGKGDLDSTPAENLSLESTSVDAIFTKKVPSQSELDVTTIVPLPPGLKTNNANNDNNEESDSIYNSISPIEHVAIQIPIIHLSETEEDDSRISQRTSPLALETPDLEQPNINLRVDWGRPNQSDESENDLQPEEAEWDSLRLRYPGVCEEKNKLGEGLSGRVFKVRSLRFIF